MPSSSILKQTAIGALTVGAVGLALPLLYLALFYAGLTNFSRWPAWELVWPTSILLLATAGHEGSVGANITVAVAVLLNAALYALLGGTAGGAWAILRSLRARGGSRVP